MPPVPSEKHEEHGHLLTCCLASHRDCKRLLEVPSQQQADWQTRCLFGHKLFGQILLVSCCQDLGFLRSQREWEKQVLSPNVEEGDRCDSCLHHWEEVQRQEADRKWECLLQITWSWCSGPVACVEVVYSFIQNTGFANTSLKMVPEILVASDVSLCAVVLAF